ncbi:YkoP family protein [Bacillus sp. GM2]|uniref:YkoP family protein n=1 Tax=Bacillus TaxID=1386 RepID=UPI0002EF86EE|nr:MULTISPECIES: hypothetical protein [Bacillus]MBY8347730.1 hypothetical protein [Bacillus sp. PCH94]AOP16497.1 uncharacterized protein BL1202_03576 [Bacillus licheniformis]ARC60127.1 hypothetical protein BaDB11_01485 [Bacillus licheniformis]ARC69340.1 hypothetical protein B34_01924 [Bacillus licheniformis]AUZ31925.1 hypothetical protein C1T27_16900 [Bacillus licheniformis]
MRNCFLSIWSVIDPFYYFFSRLTLIDQTKTSIFRVRLTKYKGIDVVLSDGTVIKKNDVLIKIHLHNIKLIKELQNIESAFRRGILIYQKAYFSMPILAEYIKNHHRSDQIKGIIGITTLHKGVERLGFEAVEPANQFYRVFKKLTQIPILYLTTKQFSLRKIPPSQYLFISKEKLFKSYLQK